METIKEEKKADLEQLLNSLVSKGWKVFGLGGKVLHISKTPDNMIYFDMGFTMERCYTLRELVSKESGLWQFVCENEMVKERNTRRENHNINSGAFMIFRKNDYEYRLIESSLKDESELESFILDNIKVDVESK